MEGTCTGERPAGLVQEDQEWDQPQKGQAGAAQGWDSEQEPREAWERLWPTR